MNIRMILSNLLLKVFFCYCWATNQPIGTCPSWKKKGDNGLEMAISTGDGQIAIIASVNGDREVDSVAINCAICNTSHLVALGVAITPILGVERSMAFLEEYATNAMPE